MTGNFWFYSKDQANNLHANITNNNDLVSFNYKAESLKNTIAEGNNSILTNIIIAVPLNYLSNFWRSLEMPLVHCKVELKLRLTKHCVLASDVKNDGGNSNNINFAVKETKLYLPVVTLLANGNQNLWKLIFKDQLIGMNIKQKVKFKSSTNE